MNKLDGAKPPNRNLVVEVLAVAAVTSLSAPMKDTFFQGEPVFLNNVTIGNASNDLYIVQLAFLTSGDVYIEDSPEAQRPTHAPRVIRFNRLAVSFI